MPISSADIALSVLPLSHIFERTGFYIFCYSGVSVYFTDPDILTIQPVFNSLVQPNAPISLSVTLAGANT